MNGQQLAIDVEVEPPFVKGFTFENFDDAWDLIAEVGTDTLETFDQGLTKIRRQEGITKSETSLLLSTQR